VAVQLLLNDVMRYFIVVFEAIGTDCAENTIPLLLAKVCWLVTDHCCDSTILALSEYATRNPVFKGFKVDAVSLTPVLDEDLDVSPLGITCCQ
jgi:hypothetical protein